MCIAIPYKVIEVKGEYQAEVEVAGNRRTVSLEIFPQVEVGDWVLVNLGFVMSKISEEEAKEVIQLYREMAQAEASSPIGVIRNERRNCHA